MFPSQVWLMPAFAAVLLAMSDPDHDVSDLVVDIARFEGFGDVDCRRNREAKWG